MPARWYASIVVALSLLLLAGCGTRGLHLKYSEPTSGPTADIVVINNTYAEAGVAFYADAERCTERRFSLGIPLYARRSLKVRAERELALSVGYTASRGTQIEICSVLVSFRPAQDAAYEAELVSGGDKCYLRVRQTAPLSRVIEPRRRVPITGITDYSDFCQP